nr:PREDICTED: BH3-interacting domain death agonist [Latimeria chalumnae]|eukprot:XP_006008261.1 PREDICTED: BH3-interacting domain death agonist [Latimeria chalumnae]
MSEEETESVLYNFLKQKQDCEKALLHLRLSSHRKDFEEEGELQTDGSISFRIGHTLEEARPEGLEYDHPIYTEIARRLAEIGDEIENKIQQNVAQQLALEMNRDKSQQAKDDSFLKAVKGLCDQMSFDLEKEKLILVTSMVLVRKVALQCPTTLQPVFTGAVRIITHIVRQRGQGSV